MQVEFSSQRDERCVLRHDSWCVSQQDMALTKPSAMHMKCLGETGTCCQARTDGNSALGEVEGQPRARCSKIETSAAS
ncbi:protein FAM [Clarias magur]|uniref:Protein FAM n=1 Tax=Clarias magur TaxID=1594786 RepID=A0A8J4TJS5_CLAMG|nr:protein FAM [Clarias magur]